MNTDTLRTALAAKVRVAELRQKIAAEKQSLDNYTAQRSAIERRAMTGRKLASPSASTSRPSPPPAPQHPHLAKLATLSGDAATLYFRQHRSAIIAEEADRQAAIASTQLSENCRAAKTGKGFQSHI